MILLRDSSSIPASCEGAALALGNFDGLHLGHRAILAETLRIARATGKPAGVMTFEPHPRRVFKPDLPPLRILPFREKARLLADMGIDFIRVVRFTRAFAQTSAEAFITQLLHHSLHVSHIVTGEDFIFGHNRAGNIAYLQAQAAALGFATTALPPVLLEGKRCSSTWLREALASGDMTSVASLLGRPYSLTGIVRQGDRRGRTIGFPTANILPVRIFLPARGVYAIRTHIAGKTVDGVANLGHRPTFHGHEVRLETHLFDWQGDLYGQRLEIQLLQHIRPEQSFSGVAALTQQIAKDCARARAALH